MIIPNNLINVGFGNSVATAKIIAITNNDSLPVKRAITEARGEHRLIDATQGRKTRTVIFTDSGHLVLSAIAAETIAARFGSVSDDELR